MRNLKVALVISGAIHIAQGIILIVAPDRISDLMEFGQLADYVPYIFASLGATFIAAAFWFILAALDPIKHINGVRFAILWSALLLVTELYSLTQSYVDFSQVWTGIVLNAIFIVAFLFFYPYRRR